MYRGNRQPKSTVVYNSQPEDLKRPVPYEGVPSQSISGNLPENAPSPDAAILPNAGTFPKTEPRSESKTGSPPASRLDIVGNMGSALASATGLDWSRSILYWNVKNGISNFNHEKDAEVYYDLEIEYTSSTLRLRREELGGVEIIRPFHEKARCTMKKLATELLVGHVFYNLDPRCAEVRTMRTHTSSRLWKTR